MRHETKMQENRISSENRKKIKEKFIVTSYINYREYLKDIFSFLKQEENKYSYYTFAEQLGFSASNVIWLVMTGKRKLSPKSGEKIEIALDFNSDEKKYFNLLIQYTNISKPGVREELFQKILKISTANIQTDNDKDIVEYSNEWYHPVIREMTNLKEFSSDPDWIASQLQVRVLPKQIQKSIELLERLNLIYFDQEKGRHFCKQGHVTPEKRYRKLAQIRFHQKMTEIARDTLAITPAKVRDYNAVTLSLNEESMAKAKDIIHHAIAKIMELETSQGCNKVIYQFNSQLFPITKKMEKKHEN